MTLDEFEEIVQEVIDELPEDFLEKLDNVEVTVQAWASQRQLSLVNARSPYHLRGLYQGVPQTKRRGTFQYPDKITIFAGPLLHAARDEAELRGLIENTVKHEIAHHFGIDDHRLREKGY